MKASHSEPAQSVKKAGPVIAIDGPAGTGKSSATKRLSEALGFVHVDTGALYRTIALLALESKQDLGLSDLSAELSQAVSKKVGEIARQTQFRFERKPDRNPSNRVLANGTDVTDRIRTPEVSLGASRVSSLPEVREALLGLQRTLGCQGRAILEGRDIGTVVFPDADVKFFLTATVEERAKRRLIELEAAGKDTPSFEELKKQMEARDHADQTRAIAPLKKAVDAIALDTTQYTLDQVVRFMEEKAREKLGLKG